MKTCRTCKFEKEPDDNEHCLRCFNFPANEYVNWEQGEQMNLTAKEQAAQCFFVQDNGLKIEDHYTFSLGEFRAFCEQLCREQREICARGQFKQPPNTDIHFVAETYIHNAPMPEL